MQTFRNTVTIARPAGEVFAFLADLRNIPRWNYAGGLGAPLPRVRRTGKRDLAGGDSTYDRRTQRRCGDRFRHAACSSAGRLQCSCRRPRLDELPDPAVETFADAHRRSAGLPATCELHVHQLGGAMARTSPGATAFSQRQPPYLINCIARTPTAEGFEANRAWARGTRDSMAKFGAGQMYVNFTGEGDEDKVRASYPAETYARLAAVKAHFDPVNRFRFNQNIRPAQAG